MIVLLPPSYRLIDAQSKRCFFIFGAKENRLNIHEVLTGQLPVFDLVAVIIFNYDLVIYLFVTYQVTFWNSYLYFLSFTIFDLYYDLRGSAAKLCGRSFVSFVRTALATLWTQLFKRSTSRWPCSIPTL